MKKWLIVLVPVCASLCLLVPHSTGSPAAEGETGAPRELLFDVVKIDGPVHDPAQHTYWFGPFAECSSVLDIDGDGKLDIAAGRNYYSAPNWTRHSDYRDGAQTNGPDVDDNYESTLDVNNDGRMDVISSGWMLRQGVWWYENPGKPGVKWESHALLEADGVEGAVVGNLAGHDGKDVLVNYFARKPGRSLIWFEHLNQAPWFRQHVLGPENVGVSHGGGIGDINGDGRNDVVTASGWFEAPPRPAEQPWIWHPDYDFAPYGAPEGTKGGAGLPMLVTDANGDGLNDIIIGSDHGYGLAWYEQKMTAGKRSLHRSTGSRPSIPPSTRWPWLTWTATAGQNSSRANNCSRITAATSARSTRSSSSTTSSATAASSAMCSRTATWSLTSGRAARSPLRTT